MPDVVSIGNMLVEIMRVNLDEPFDRPGTFVGPFPSGDTPIYIDTVARLGYHAGFIGVVGDDGFGRLLLDRLTATAWIARACACCTTTRRALPLWPTSATAAATSSSTGATLLPACCRRTTCRPAICRRHAGCTSLAAIWRSSDSARQACYRAIDLRRRARVSFDPNIRPGALSIADIRDLCRPAIERADVILPSLSEAAMLTGLVSDEAGCRLWAEQGKTVVLKMGAHGCRIFSGNEDLSCAGLPGGRSRPNRRRRFLLRRLHGWLRSTEWAWRLPVALPMPSGRWP